MKYWAFLVAKIAAAGAVLLGLRMGLVLLLPKPSGIWTLRRTCSGMTLTYILFDAAVHLVRRGRLLGHRLGSEVPLPHLPGRLRMPVLTGSWTNVLFGAPRTEYICPYGHGTLKVAELGRSRAASSRIGSPHEDIWKELESLEETKK